MPDENLLFLKDFAAIYTVHSTLVYYALSNYRISTTVKGLQFVCFVTLRWCYSSLLTNFLRYYCISCISVPTLSLQNTCQGNQLRAHQLPQHLLKTSQRICLHILLPLLLIHIYGHNRSIFGRSSISHRLICGTGQPRITFHSQLLSILYRVAKIRVLHRMLFLICIYKSNPLE